ncbi:MAG TPA: hypothetical protein VGC49_04770 [Solirubrobacterales bacterium]|jgi:hypothetical protein
MDIPTWKKRLESLGPKGDGNAPSERIRLSAIVAVVLALGLLVWLLLIKGDGDEASPASQPSASSKQVSLVSQSELLGALKGVGYPVYWAGPRLGVDYEVSRLPEGRTYVRYLPEGEKAESKNPFLTVGSYEQANALKDITKLGQKPGAVLVEIVGGGSAYAEGPDATSAYMAFPGVDTQVEVYDPQGGRALKLIRSGAIVPVG